MIPQMEPWFDEKEANAVHQYVLSGGFLTEFKITQEFENMIKEYVGVKHCFAVNNGTLAIVGALIALNVKPGDEVIVPDITMIATPNAARLLGAKVVFADIDKETMCLDIDNVEKHITQKTKVIIHVSLNARCNDIEKLQSICKKHDVKLLEDSAQALGSFYKGKHLGTYGDIGTFSFSPPKIISTGQGGAIVTNDDVLATKLKKIKDFGRESGGNDFHDEFGVNFKFTDMQAAVGVEQMKKLPWRVNRIKEIWNIYYGELKDYVQMFEPNDDGWIPWFVDIYTEDRDELSKYLLENQIKSRPIYPPIHKQKVYGDHNGLNFPISEYYGSTGLWLPSSTKLTDEEILQVCGVIKKFYNKPIVRKIVMNDYEQYVKLIKQLIDFDETESTRSVFEKMICQSTILVVKVDGKLVATGKLAYDQKISGKTIGFIEDIVVDNEYRGNGYGKLLMSQLIEKGKFDCYKFVLNCKDDKIDFYKKCGMKTKDNNMVIYTDDL